MGPRDWIDELIDQVERVACIYFRDQEEFLEFALWGPKKAVVWVSLPIMMVCTSFFLGDLVSWGDKVAEHLLSGAVAILILYFGGLMLYLLARDVNQRYDW